MKGAKRIKTEWQAERLSKSGVRIENAEKTKSAKSVPVTHAWGVAAETRENKE